MNEKIRSKEVRLIDDEGNNHGVVSIAKARQMADDKDLDLVVVSQNQEPPVCKIMDYGKYKYEIEKRAKRQAEGIAIAKAAGKYKGRKPIEISESLFKAVYDKWKAGTITAVQAQKELGIKSNTFYRRVNEYEANMKK